MQAKIVNKIIIYLLIFLLGCNILNPSDDNINESIISLFFLNSINTSSTEDTKSPTPGNNGTITTSNIYTNGMTLTWNIGIDDVTRETNLQYRAYYSTTSSFDSISEVESGTTIGDWQTNINTINVNGLSISTTYYFNVLIKNITCKHSL